MEIFDDINTVIENAGNTAKQKTKDMTDVAKMMASIKTEEKRLQEVYQQIGELVVKKYYAVTEDTLGELLNQAKEYGYSEIKIDFLRPYVDNWNQDIITKDIIDSFRMVEKFVNDNQGNYKKNIFYKFSKNFSGEEVI